MFHKLFLFPELSGKCIIYFYLSKVNLLSKVLNYRYIERSGGLSQTTEISHSFLSGFRKKLCSVKVVLVKVWGQHSEREYNWNILMITRASGVPMTPQRRKGGKVTAISRTAISSSFWSFPQMKTWGHFRSQWAMNKC